MSDPAIFNKLRDTRLLFMGPPGSGKGTQCKHLKAELGLPHLSTGDILRQGISEGQAECLKAKSYIDSGNLVPDDLIIAIFEERLAQPDCGRGFILDGFPRTLPQAESLDVLLKQLGRVLNKAFYLVVEDQIIIERTTGRLSCTNSKCGAVYHIKYAPPKVDGICDICDQPLAQRSDDKVEIVAERLKVYKELTAPLIEFYKKAGLLQEIDGSRSREAIYADIIRVLETAAVGGK